MQNENEIIVRTPLGVKSHHLRELVTDNQKWILNSLKKIKPRDKFDFIYGGQLPFLGEEYGSKLIIDESMVNPKFVLKDEIFYIYYSQKRKSYDDFVAGLAKFYQQMAVKIINPIFDKWSAKTNLYPSKITYKKTKTIWGSCSHLNNISINYMILQFPMKSIEYVVLHELCHITEKNHSKRFWNLVSFYMSDYKTDSKALKNRIF